MHQANQEAAKQARQLREAIFWAAGFVAVLWSIKLFEYIAGTNFIGLGILPGHIKGLWGILFAPLIHSSWAHLAANSGPMLILGAVLYYGYPRSARIVLPVIYLLTGAIVWLFARPHYHVGASGLTFGMLFFITVIGLLRWDKPAIALALASFFLYGGMMGGLFPESEGISYETHIAAAGLGVVLAFVLKNYDPPPPRKIYSWELEGDEDDGIDWDEFLGDEENDVEDYEEERRRGPSRYLH
ncbi:MAG TPA: rhomboid family intramembrane serine protease [Gammaproteobacteria bacterium]